MGELIGAYLVVTISVFFVCCVLLIIAVMEYRDYDHRMGSYAVEGKKNLRPWIRKWLYGTLLSPVWPVLFVIALVSFVSIAFKIVMED